MQLEGWVMRIERNVPREKWHGLFRALAMDRRGATAITTALSMFVLVGLVGFGTEVGTWYLARRNLQSAVDAGAASGVVGASAAGDAIAEARAAAAQHGVIDGVNGFTLHVSRPPTAGSLAGDSAAVEVVATHTVPVLFSALFLGESTLRIEARAVATVPPGEACVVGLETSESEAVKLWNNASLLDPDCGVAVNSSSASALVVSNNASIAGPVSVHGGWSVGNNGRLAGSPNKQNAPRVRDPYAMLTVPDGTSLPPCTTQPSEGGKNARLRLHPGRFCSGWNYANNATIDLDPGTYYIQDTLTVGNNATINGDGVTIVLVDNAILNIGNNVTLNLKAPETGDYAGIVILSDRDGLPTTTQTFSNNVTLNVTGVIYMPNQKLLIENNGAGSFASGCTQIVARKVELRNNAGGRPGIKCDGAGTRRFGIGGPSRLVE